MNVKSRKPDPVSVAMVGGGGVPGAWREEKGASSLLFSKMLRRALVNGCSVAAQFDVSQPASQPAHTFALILHR